MRALLAILIALTAPCAASIVPDTGAIGLSSDSEARWIPYTLTPGNQIRFTAELDGQPVSAILDTGASVTVLSRDEARRSGRKVAERGEAAAIGGRVAMGWTGIATLSFGGLTRAGGGLNVVELPRAVTGNDGAVALLIGRDLLDRFALEIDPVTQRFRLLKSGRMPFTGLRAPLSVGRAPLAYVTELIIAGRRLRPIIVDTGDGTALTLARNAWRTLPLDPAPVTTTLLAYGVGGQIEAEMARLPDLSLGQVTAHDVGVWIEPTGGFSDTARAAGRIGMGLLRRYRMLLDPGAGHMILVEAQGTLPARNSTSGLQLGLTRDRLRVLHVMRGSPAATGGWRAGDTICAVDGARIADDPAAAARSDWPVGPPGTKLLLGMCDGTERRLTLRRFY